MPYILRPAEIASSINFFSLSVSSIVSSALSDASDESFVSASAAFS
jgi:hypothetical protein